MRILFIGGTGNISLSCTKEAVSRGFEVFHLNRGTHAGITPEGVTTITADIRDPEAVKKALSGMKFDSVTDWVAFTPEHIKTDIGLFAGITEQYIFISSASAYQKPCSHYIITESTPLANPFWEYSRNKIACEMLLREAFVNTGFPATIVRPSHTYSDGWFPTAFGSRDFTIPQRMLDGRPVLIHGDGTSLWTLTHADDFARGFIGLPGNPATIGETFHITSDEALSWDMIHETIGRALGVKPVPVHMPSEVIARYFPDLGASLLGDKAHSVVFDNTKIKRFVPGYKAVIPFHEGMRRSVAWCSEAPERKAVNKEIDAVIDRLLRYGDGGLSG